MTSSIITNAIARGWVTMPAPTPPAPVKPKQVRPWARKPRPGKNITVAREWVAQQKGIFTFRELAEATGIDSQAAKYTVWALRQKKEIVAVGKAPQAYNPPIQYRRAA